MKNICHYCYSIDFQRPKFMKIIRIIFLVFFLVLNVSSVLSQPLPCPSCGPDPENPLEGPIDEDLPYLIAAGLLLGTAVIYRNKIKKASI
jgi:hypothetical protein